VRVPEIADEETTPPADQAPLLEGRESFEWFYRREYRRVLVLAHVWSGNPSLAEELTQEAFIAAYREWDRIDSPEWWIRTVLANKARSTLRRRYAEARALARVGARRETTVDAMPAESAHFWAEVRRLPARQAQAITLFYLEDRSVADTAAILGCSESTARVHLMRGRTALAQRLAVEET
jgi:RNA polymerase sigma-70 factor (ECF subfamily)